MATMPTTIPRWCRCRTPVSDSPLESEKLQAAYVVRWNMILMAGGVEKIFYHAGTCDGVNRDSLQGIFFEYAGEPHKVYTAPSRHDGDCFP